MPFKSFVKKIFNKFGLDIKRYPPPRELGSVASKFSSSLNGLDLPYTIMRDCKLLPNREFALSLLPKGGIMAEIGVAYGDFTQKIIETLNPSKFYAIDIFTGGPENEFWNRNDFSKLNLGQEDFIKQRFKEKGEQGVFYTKKGLSWDVLETFDDNYFDYVYLDAGHDYDSVKKDISVLLRKIKDKGIVSFNDYTLYDWNTGFPYGIIRAVDEMLIHKTHEIIYFCLHKGGFNDIIIKINK